MEAAVGAAAGWAAAAAAPRTHRAAPPHPRPPRNASPHRQPSVPRPGTPPTAPSQTMRCRPRPPPPPSPPPQSARRRKRPPPPPSHLPQSARRRKRTPPQPSHLPQSARRGARAGRGGHIGDTQRGGARGEGVEGGERDGRPPPRFRSGVRPRAPPGGGRPHPRRLRSFAPTAARLPNGAARELHCRCRVERGRRADGCLRSRHTPRGRARRAQPPAPPSHNEVRNPFETRRELTTTDWWAAGFVLGGLWNDSGLQPWRSSCTSKTRGTFHTQSGSQQQPRVPSQALANPKSKPRKAQSPKPSPQSPNPGPKPFHLQTLPGGGLEGTPSNPPNPSLKPHSLNPPSPPTKPPPNKGSWRTGRASGCAWRPAARRASATTPSRCGRTTGSAPTGPRCSRSRSSSRGFLVKGLGFRV